MLACRRSDRIPRLLRRCRAIIDRCYGVEPHSVAVRTVKMNAPFFRGVRIVGGDRLALERFLCASDILVRRAEHNPIAPAFVERDAAIVHRYLIEVIAHSDGYRGAYGRAFGSLAR